MAYYRRAGPLCINGAERRIVDMVRQMFYICSQNCLDQHPPMRQNGAKCCMVQHTQISSPRDIVAAKHRVSVNLAQEEYHELAALSEQHRVSMAWLSRQAIIEFLERYRNDELQLPLRLPPGRSDRQKS